MRAVEQLAGMPLPASSLETLVLPSRVVGYSPALLDELTLSGDVVWAGAGSLAGNDGWVVLAPAEIAPLILPTTDDIDDPLAVTLRDSLTGDEAVFFRSLADRAAAPGEFATDDAVARAVWELVWAGLLTNDTLAPLRALLGAGRTAHARKPRPAVRRRGRYSGLGGGLGSGFGSASSANLTGPAGASSVRREVPFAMGGRWSAVPVREPDATRRALTAAEVLLDRYGVVTRGAVMAERIVGGFSAVYPVLKVAEESGRARRGYFVDGLGAAQFAFPGAVDRLRAEARPLDSRSSDGVTALVLAATDPGNPYGAALRGPRPRVLRTAAAAINPPASRRPGRTGRRDVRALRRARRPHPAELRRGSSVLQPAADALALAVRDGALGRLQVERADGNPISGSALGEALSEAGFRPTPRGLRLRA